MKSRAVIEDDPVLFVRNQKKKTKQKRASTFGTGPTRVAANVNSTSTVNGVVPGKIGLHINASSSVRGREIRV